MKALLAVLTLFVGLNAQARSIQTTVNHVLPVVTIDGQPSKLVGVVKVDIIAKEITLELFDDICGTYTAKPGTITCLAMPILKAEYVAPLQTRKSDGCGTAIYAGKEDKRPVDGNLTAIKLVDNSSRVCEDVLRNLAEVTVVSQTAGMGGPATKKVVKASTERAF